MAEMDRSRFETEIKLRFDAEGISIPYPQRDLHIVSGSAA